MPIIHPVALEHELKRWMRADAHRFIHPDWRHFAKPGSELEALYGRYERKYSSDQPRVPAGVPQGGQWTSEGGGAAGAGMAERTRIAGTVIPICVVEGKALFGDGTHTVTYRCADGRSIRRGGPGHAFPGIILQPR